MLANSRSGSNAPALSRLLEKLQKVKPGNRPGTYRACCPNHDDRDPSLSITEKQDKILLNCHAGCRTKEILNALGMDWPDLFLRRGSRSHRTAKKPILPTPCPTREPDKRFAKLAQQCFQQRNLRFLRELARQLGVSFEALSALMVGRDNSASTWPEHDGKGRICNVQRRYLSGKKISAKGGKRGLYLPKGWRERVELQNMLLVAEGGSDTAALWSIGLPVIGKPAASLGDDFLEDLLRDLPSVEIIIVADNDDSGREGARRTAERLSVTPDRPILLFASKGKDAREWLKAQCPHIDSLPPKQRPALGQRFIQEHRKTAETVTGICIRTELQIPVTDCPLFFDVTKPCRRGHICHFKHRIDPNLEAAFKLACGRWTCTGCAERLRQGWMEQLFSGLNGRERVYVWQGKTDEWIAVRSRIKRATGGFFKIRSSFLLVITPNSFPGSQELESAHAVLDAAKALQDIVPGRTRRPVTVGGDFAPPLPKPPRKWHRLGRVPVDETTLERNLAREHERDSRFHYRHLSPAPGVPWRVGWWFDPAHMEEAREMIRLRLFGKIVPLEIEETFFDSVINQARKRQA